MNRIDLNNGWEFTSDYFQGFERGDGKGEAVRIPHTCAELPFNYCDENDYQMLCGYRKAIEVPEQWLDKRVLLTFGAAAHVAEVFLNGEKIAEHRCGYTSFTIELTVLRAGENLIAVRLDTREKCDVPPFGYVIDYLTYGGLYREVWLDIKEKAYFADVFSSARVQLTGKGKKEKELCSLLSELTVAGRRSLSDGAEISIALKSADGVLLGSSTKKLSAMDGAVYAEPYGIPAPMDDCVRLSGLLEYVSPALWSPQSPVLYTAEYTLSDCGGVLDTKSVKVGFRSAIFKSDGFYLNGRKLKLRGLNRHQSYPYAGYAMPRSMQRLDADILKRELGVNIVRTSHYPQSHHFIERCDELGLLVFTEIPGWQHIGGEAWQEQAVENTSEMVTQYRCHPSIILWGVRINESPDNDELYKKTNAAARALDDTRATSGVRNIEQSHLLEDVYAHNDFSYSGGDKPALKPKKQATPDMSKGYIVSEHSGHMFPTKSFDDEEHRLEHAKRHAAVLDAMYASGDIAGSIGWCMFDYNTHKDFGSGDKICYHGVTDMFRNPKLAAALYASQSDEGDVFEVSNAMTLGDHPCGRTGEIYVFTNADSVRVSKNGELLTEYICRDGNYPHLPHPPVLIEDLIGDQLERVEGFPPKTAKRIKNCLIEASRSGGNNLSLGLKLKLLSLMATSDLTMDDGVRLFGKYIGNWGGGSSVFRFDAVKNGKVVKSVVRDYKACVVVNAKVSATALVEGATYDVALVRLTADDANGNRLSYYGEPACLKASGAIELIGRDIVPMRGGACGAFVRTRGEAGTGQLVIEAPGAQPCTVDFTVSIE